MPAMWDFTSSVKRPSNYSLWKIDYRMNGRIGQGRVKASMSLGIKLANAVSHSYSTRDLNCWLLVHCRLQKSRGDSEPLLETAAWLYQLQGRYDFSLAILLKLRRQRVFDFIASHHLMPLLKGQAVTQLLSIDPQQAESLLIDFREEALPAVVIPAIQVMTISCWKQQG